MPSKQRPSLYSDGRKVYRRTSPDLPPEGRRIFGLDADPEGAAPVQQPDRERSTAPRRAVGRAVGTGDYGKMTVPQLEAEVARRGLTPTGTGASGNVVKADLLKALNA